MSAGIRDLMKYEAVYQNSRPCRNKKSDKGKGNGSEKNKCFGNIIGSDYK